MRTTEAGATKLPKGTRILKMRDADLYRYSVPCRARGCEAQIQGCWFPTRREAAAGAPPVGKQRCAAHCRRRCADHGPAHERDR